MTAMKLPRTMKKTVAAVCRYAIVVCEDRL